MDFPSPTAPEMGKAMASIQSRFVAQSTRRAPGWMCLCSGDCRVCWEGVKASTNVGVL